MGDKAGKIPMHPMHHRTPSVSGVTRVVFSYNRRRDSVRWRVIELLHKIKKPENGLSGWRNEEYVLKIGPAK